MEIILKTLWCGHMPGSKHMVSDERGIYLMIEGIAEPDVNVLAQQQAKIHNIKKIAKSETAISKAAKNSDKAIGLGGQKR